MMLFIVLFELARLVEGRSCHASVEVLSHLSQFEFKLNFDGKHYTIRMWFDYEDDFELLPSMDRAGWGGAGPGEAAKLDSG